MIISLLAACNKGDPGNSDSEQSPDLAAVRDRDSLVVKMSRQAQQLEEIRVVVPDTQSFRNSLQAYGTVLSPSGLIALRDRQAKLQHRIRNQKAQREVSLQEYKRQDTLYQHNGTSRKDWQQARAKWIADQTDLETTQQSLRTLIDSSKAHWGPVIPTWIQKNAAKTQHIINRDAWIVRVTPGEESAGSFQPAKTALMGDRQQTFPAQYISISPTMNLRIQKRSYYYLADQPPVPLASGQNLDVSLPIGPPKQGVIIPDAAVIWTQGAPWFYEQQSPEEFRRRPLSSAHYQHGQWYLPRSFSPAQSVPGVVVSGASILLAQEQRAGQPTISKDEEGDID